MKITLKDEVSNIFVHLYYAVFEDFDVITRWTVVENRSGGTVEIARVMSATVDFDNMRYDVISNFGSWSRERHLERGPVRHGIFETDLEEGLLLILIIRLFFFVLTTRARHRGTFTG